MLISKRYAATTVEKWLGRSQMARLKAPQSRLRREVPPGRRHLTFAERNDQWLASVVARNTP
ncbi:MAG: hypothetical protein RIK87_14765 [Fuerstiella sp.]